MLTIITTWCAQSGKLASNMHFEFYHIHESYSKSTIQQLMKSVSRYWKYLIYFFYYSYD